LTARTIFLKRSAVEDRLLNALILLMDLKLGDKFTTSRDVTDELIRKFADVSGDYNPIHLDEEFAKNTRFGKRIAHGMLSGAFISAVLGYELKERKIVYLSQTLKFTAPVFIGDTVTATATVINIREDKPIVTLETVCTNQNGETLVTGEAAVMVLP
jgi:3-hydroxybutyryl-CoA dehydratase